MAKTEQLTHDTNTSIHGEADILRRLRNVEAKTQMAKSQNANGQKPKAKWPK